MTAVNGELVDHYWSRVESLASEAESGESVASELKQIIEDAIEAFMRAGNFEMQLQALVSDLFVTRDAYRDERPVFASIFARAGLLASDGSVELA